MRLAEEAGGGEEERSISRGGRRARVGHRRAAAGKAGTEGDGRGMPKRITWMDLDFLLLDWIGLDVTNFVLSLDWIVFVLVGLFIGFQNLDFGWQSITRSKYGYGFGYG